MTLGLVVKVRESGMTNIPACLDPDPDLTWDQDDFQQRLFEGKDQGLQHGASGT